MSKATLLRLATNDVVNVAAVTHRSPFRYPGGKTWLVPTVRLWLRTRKNRPRVLAEPFAGGAIVSLSALFENLVNQIVLIEKDEDVAAVWKEIIYGDGIRLAREILFFDLSEDSAKALLSKQPTTQFERAFSTIVRNRVQRGGILAPGASFIKNEENRKGIRSHCARRRELTSRLFHVIIQASWRSNRRCIKIKIEKPTLRVVPTYATFCNVLSEFQLAHRTTVG